MTPAIRGRIRLGWLVVALTFVPAVALAQQGAPDNVLALGSSQIYDKSLKALTILLVAAILIENALAVVFNWRVFLTYFSLRGVKTIVSFAVSYVVVLSFDIDVVGDLMSAYMTPEGATGTEVPNLSSPVSRILTALILAGGSGGVNNLMVALGYRDRGRDEDVAPSAPPNKAWIAVWVKRDKVVGPVRVHVTEVPAPDPAPDAIAGTIGFRRPSLLELLMRNPNRFPANGGYEVEPGKVYRIDVVGLDRDGEPIPNPVGREVYRFAPRAIADFEVSL